MTITAQQSILSTSLIFLQTFNAFQINKGGRIMDIKLHILHYSGVE
jgi:hypothetical protein